jgi:hypothetical protein
MRPPPALHSDDADQPGVQADSYKRPQPAQKTRNSQVCRPVSYKRPQPAQKTRNSPVCRPVS